MGTRKTTAASLNWEKSTFIIQDATVKTSDGTELASVPTLTFLAGEALGKELPLLRPEVSIGRGAECDIVVPDPSVSRIHARLSCRKDAGSGPKHLIRVVVRDMDSTNGTVLNCRRVTRAVLKPGDKIGLGRTLLRFEYRDLADRNFYDEIYRMATRDGLTGLFNKATITRMLCEEIEKHQRYRRRFSLLLIDLDNFKVLNDTLGHVCGDRVLQTAAEVLRASLRRQDRAGRFGGEEFLVLLPETGARGAAISAARIRRALEQSVAATLKLSHKVTASIGVASCDAAAPDVLLERADLALYRAKAMGKNRVEVWRNAAMSMEHGR